MAIAIVLFIVFLVLKLTSVVLWSWWYVTAPLWIALLVFVILLMIAAASLPENADY